MKGRVFWLTGLSGSGKTALARLLVRHIRKKSPAVVHLDGDVLRSSLWPDLGYDSRSREDAAMRYARLCRLLSDQGCDVVISTISLFHRVHQWNRKNLARYHEIYLKVPLTVVQSRNSKKIYSRSKKKKIKNVVGVDIPVQVPKRPDLIVPNSRPRHLSRALALITRRFHLS